MLSRFPFKPLHPSVPIADRLRTCLPAWRHIAKDPFVLEVIEHGYRFNFRSKPPTPRPAAPLFHGTPAQMADLTRQLLEWQRCAVIEPDLSQPTRRVASLLFPVPKKDSVEFRWCHDLRYLNDWLKVSQVKYETVESVRQMIRKGDFMTSIDLKSAYSHVLIDPKHRDFLCFDALGRRWKFRALPFGVSSAPYVFTRVMRTVMQFFRNQGIRISIYLDDMIIMAKTPGLAHLHTQYVLNVLEALGFVINRSKSCLEPSRQISHLGLIFDSYRWQITLPQSKLLNIAKDARRILRANERKCLTMRMIAGLAGKLAAAVAAMPEARFRNRSMQRLVWFAIRHGRTWSDTVSLSATALRDVVWCSNKSVLHRANRGRIRVSHPDAILTSDASLTGWGAVLEIDGKSISVHGRWNPIERDWSSNLRETTAITRSVFAFKRRLVRCRSILFRTDNMTAKAALNKCGSPYRHLGLAIEPVLRLAFRHRISIRAIHLPGSENLAADALSRLTPEVNEWRLSDSAAAICLSKLRAVFRQPRGNSTCSLKTTATTRSPACDEVDWFASESRHLVPQFASRTADPSASFVDAMSQTWTERVGIWVPPFNLIPRVLSKIGDEQAHGLVVVPFWPSRPWYGTLKSMAMTLPTHLPFDAYRPALGVDQLRRPPALTAFIV